MKSFECSSCGLCCRPGIIPELPDDWDRGDGFCKHLTEEMTCSIYDERPLPCRVDESWDDVEQGARMRTVLQVETREQMHAALTEGCKLLQDIQKQIEEKESGR